MTGGLLLLLVVAGLAIGFVTWMFAVYALPALIGLGAARWAYESGAAFWGAGLVGLGAAVAAFAVLRASYRSFAYPPLRFFLAAVVCVPSMAVGYHVMDDLAVLGGSAPQWTSMLSFVSGGLVGLAAFVRLVGGPKASELDDPPD